MMNYEEFKTVVAKDMVNYIPEHYKDREFTVEHMVKENVEYDALILGKKNTGNPGTSVSPALNIGIMYNEYAEGSPIVSVLTKYGKEFERAVTIGEQELSNLMNVQENFRENVFFTLVNAEVNKKLLENVPHRLISNLAVIYRMEISRNSEAVKTMTVTNSLMTLKGLTEEELFELAYKNTRAKYGIVVKDMMMLLMEKMNGAPSVEYTEDVNIDINKAQFNANSMLVCTNTIASKGAAVILYTDILNEICEMYGSDLLILPSSVHECILLSAKSLNNNYKDLLQMVREVNSQEVGPEDFLADNVYYYKRNSKEITIAA